MDGVYVVRGRNLYRITYTAGFDFDNSATFLGDTDAADLEVAAWLMAQDVWSSKGLNSNIKSERIGDYAVSYGEVMKTMFSNPQAHEILDTFRELRGDGVLTPLQAI